VAADTLAQLFEDLTPRVILDGLISTEGPLWHPDGTLYFAAGSPRKLYRLLPSGKAEVALDNPVSGCTFDLEGGIVICDGTSRRVLRWTPGIDSIEVLAERFDGERFSRPNDVVCRSDGSLYFTDPGMRVPLHQREMLYSSVFRIHRDGAISLVADCEFPNGLAFSPDERTLYVANSRWVPYLHALHLDAGGVMLRRRVFADMPADTAHVRPPPRDVQGAPDGLALDNEGRVYCTGADGLWLFDAEGTKLGIVPFPEVISNCTFGSADLRTLYVTGRSAIFTLRTTTPGQPHPWYATQ
jgi:gluconolactonase